MSSLLDHLDSNQSENDDIHLLFPKCKPRASSVGTESQSSESQSNSQQYLADNFRDQNLNHHHHQQSLQHHPSSVSVSSGGGGGIGVGGGGVGNISTRQSSRRHSSSGFTHHQSQNQHQQQQYQQQQQLPDNLLKPSKHSSYPPLLANQDNSPTGNSGGGNITYIGHGPLSPYDNNNLAQDNNKTHHHQLQQYQQSSRQHQHHHLQQQQSDSSDNFPLTPSFSSSHYSGNNLGGGIINPGNNSGGSSNTGSNNKKVVDGYNHNNHSGSVKSHHHHHSRSKNSISSRNSRHEAATVAALISAGGSVINNSGSVQGQSSRHHSRSSHHSHHNHQHHSSSVSERPHHHHHHRSKKGTHMTESSSCEPISSTATGNKGHRYSSKSQREPNCGGGGGGGPTKSYSTLSLGGSGMECEPLDEPHHHHYDDGFSNASRCGRNLAAGANSNGASYPGEHGSLNTTRNPGGGGGCLRDSRIEIAGGKEIYSQNRIRAGRRLRGSSSTSSSTEMMADSSMSITASSSSSAGNKHIRKKSPNMQLQLQQQQQLAYTNGDIGEGGDGSVWEPKHGGNKPYQDSTIPPRSSHHHHSSGGHRHHHHQHHHHHPQQHHSHGRNRHVCGYTHCDHPKLLSPTDISPSCGGHNNPGGKSSTPVTVKETVFSSEVTSIEKPIETDISVKSATQSSTSGGTGMQPPYVYETSVVHDSTGGEIIFDDIGNWSRVEGGLRSGRRNSSANEAGLCVDRNRKEGMKRSPSTGNKHSNMQGVNFFHNGVCGGDNDLHCCTSLEQMEQHSGSSVNASSAPTVLLQGSPSPSIRGGNTTPSGYESDEYSGVTPVSNNMFGGGVGKGCMANNRLIGALPIAEYEGSPKRYGLRQPTHPMPTHLDLVDVDMQINVGSVSMSATGPSDAGSGGGGGGGATHLVSLTASPNQPNCKPTVPTSASSSSSSSLDNTNSNSNISSTSSGRNLYGSSRISPRMISPSQSVSNFPSRVPGFPQRITPVTSSLDSSSLVDSGLEKSEATDIRSDSVLETGEEADVLMISANFNTNTASICHPNSINSDECPREPIMKGSQDHSQHHQYYYAQKSGDDNSNAYNFRGSDNDEPPPSSQSCQGQLVNSEREDSSDLLLTDQLNIEGEKCNPSSTTNLCGNPLDDTDQMQPAPHKPQYHNMVLELVDSGPVVVAADSHHQSLQQNIILSGSGSTPTVSGERADEQCLISVPSSSSQHQTETQEHHHHHHQLHRSETGGEEGSDMGSNLLEGIGGANSSTDYLYEFSETRKVLEEFFGNNAGAGGGGSGACGVVGSSGASCLPGVGGGSLAGMDGTGLSLGQGPFFDDLDYTLKRQTGNSYVGQRLAGESFNAVEESPKKPTRRGVLLLGSSDGDGGEGGDAASPRLISFQEITLPQLPGQKGVQNPPRDLNDNDIDGDSSSTNTETDNLGDTEVGLQVGLSRNFTLSPETTDCDSNELESEISLDYEASLHSSSRVGVSMPAVEDGLSSGNVSDTEEILPSSEQLNTDLKKSRAQQQIYHQHQQGLFLANHPPSNNISGGRQPSSIGGVQRRREQHQNQHPSGYHHHHHHHHHHQHHLLEDELVCYGTEQEDAGAASASLSSPASSSLPLPQSTSSQHPPLSPSSGCSTTTVSANAKIPSDPNPTLLLMKKQISEIEKEIKMRASQQSQSQKMQLQQNYHHHHHHNNHHHSVENSNSNTHNNSVISVSDVTEQSSSNAGAPANNNGGSVTNIPSMNSGSSNGGSSCVPTSNGNGLASQLNVSSCPDVSTLSGGTGTTSGQGSCYNQQQQQQLPTPNGSCGGEASSLTLVSSNNLQNTGGAGEKGQETTNFDSIDIELEALDPMRPTPPPSPAPSSMVSQANNHRSSSSSLTPSVGTGNSKAGPINIPTVSGLPGRLPSSATSTSNSAVAAANSNNTSGISPDSSSSSSSSVAAAIQDIKEAIQRTKTLPRQQPSSSSSAVSHVEQTSRPSPLTSTTQQSHADPNNSDTSPVWVPRQGSSYHHHRSGGGGGGVKDPLLRKQRYDETPDDDADTDQETDRLLGQTRTEDDYGFYDEKEWKKVKSCRSLLPALNKGVSFVKSAASGSTQPLGLSTSASSLNTGGGGAGGGGGPSISSSSNHGLPTPNYSSTSNTIAPSSARISPAPFKQQEQQPLPSSQLSTNNSSSNIAANSVSNKPKKDKDGIKKKRSKEDFKNPSVLIEGVLFRARYLGSTQLVCEGQPTKATRMMQAEEAVSRIKTADQSDLSSETEQTGTCTVSQSDSGGGDSFHHDTSTTIATAESATATTTSTSTTTASTSTEKGEGVQSGPQFEDYLYAEDDDSGDESCAESEFFHKPGRHHSVQSPTSSARSFQGPCFGGTSSPGDNPGTGTSHFGPACGSALPGTMFRLKFVGSLEVDEEVGSGKRRRKRPKKVMVEEAVFKMKAPEGETQPSTEVDLFISTEKIMVLNTDLKEIMMDHALRTISYIADIGDLVVLMARRRPVPSDTPEDTKIARPPKMICHVFESDEAQYIAQSIGQAFQVAYMEFLKANGIEDQSFVREMDYQEVLNSQEIFGDELQMFAKKELQKEVVVPKSKGEILGVVIVESGWGSMLPTVVIANLAPAGAAARCGQLNIGDQIIAINGVSLVGLPLSTCQNYIKNTKSQTVVKLTVVPCPPVVEVKIKRPDTKYQLGFSVQNGVICSLLRGGIAERGGVRVGHRIIEINGQSVVAVPHEKIVNLLATSVGEINMKTMPTSMFRLLTGQETPLYI